MSFATPANASIVERDNPSGQHIDLPNRHGEVMDPRKAAYGVLEIDGEQTLIVAGRNKDRKLYCESYKMNDG